MDAPTREGISRVHRQSESVRVCRSARSNPLETQISLCFRLRTPVTLVMGTATVHSASAFVVQLASFAKESMRELRISGVLSTGAVYSET